MINVGEKWPWSEAGEEEGAGDDEAEFDEQDEDAFADPADDLLAGPGAEQRGRGEGRAEEQDLAGEQAPALWVAILVRCIVNALAASVPM
nr:hypothetical protein [Amycolatopsis sp. Hca4]